MPRAVLSLKESSRERIVEVARALEPHFPDLSATWRDRITSELKAEGRVVVAMERLMLPTGCSYFCAGDFEGFFDNVAYFARRLAKLQVDTRSVARAFELYQLVAEPYINSIFGERRGEAMAALETLSSTTFVSVAGAYFDAQSMASQALLAILDAELSAGDLPTVLQRVLEITIRTFGACVGRVRLRDENDNLLVAASFGLANDPETPQLHVGEGFSGHISETGEPVLVLDPAKCDWLGDLTLRAAARTLWGVPLKAKSRVIGVMIIGFDKPYEWLPTERDLLRAIADRSAMAIERATMTDQLREREAQIAELSAHLLRAQEDERKRISRELHDETGQGLMVIRLYLGMLQQRVTRGAAREKIQETLDVVDRTVEGLRRIIGKLSPLMLQELGLVAALRKLAKDLTKNTGIKTRMVIPDAVGRLAPEAEIAMYRVVQEALHNVAKHSQAKSVTVQIARENHLVRVLVEDDGVGMVPGKGHPRGHSFGVAGIKERVGMLGGEVRLTSVRGKGTRLEFTVPGPPLATPLKPAARAGANHTGPIYRVN